MEKMTRNDDKQDEYRTISFEEIWAQLSPERRERIKAMGEESRKDMEILDYLQNELHLTPEGLAEILAMPRDEIARIVRQGDLILAALQNGAASAGGKISILVELPNREPLKLSEIADVINLQRDP